MNCYLCGGGGLQTIATELRYGQGRVLRCPRCDLGMLEERPASLDDYYLGEYRRHHGPAVGQEVSYDAIFDAYVRHQARRVDLLRPYLGPQTRFLEVGCSTGHILANIAPLTREAVGVDLDAGAAAFAAERTGCTTYGVSLEETDLELGSFDVVSAIQTLEHVPDPVAFAKLLATYVRPEGTVYLEVPNLYDALRVIYDSPGYRRFYFHRAHLFYFSQRSLELVTRRAGLKGTISSTQDYNFLNHLHWALTGEPQLHSEPGLGLPRLPLVESHSEIAAELGALLVELDARYKTILERHGFGENLVFIGRRA